MRDDEDPDDLPEVTADMLTGEPELKRPSWSTTLNEIVVQHPVRFDE